MADSTEAPQTGGGEGPAPSLPQTEATPEVKPIDTNAAPQSGGGEGLAPAISIPDATLEVKPTESSNANPTAEHKEEPVLPAQPVEPAQPTKSVQPIESVQSAESADPVQTLQQEEPRQSVTPAQLEQPIEEAASVAVAEESKSAPVEPIEQNANSIEQIQIVPQTATTEFNWQQREAELLKKIAELEQLQKEKNADSAKLLLKVREEEIDLLKARVKNLETELHAALSKPGGKNQEMIANIKQQHEELLSKAKGMIFDKTKMVKNQELQIEALTTQVQSLKDINLITKDLLEIRNSEVKAMEERFQAMEARFKAEKERYSLVLQRAQTSTNINDDLRKEYETQLAIFKELREKYEQKVQALVAENERLKASVQGGGTSG